jgi:AcrR family transcriptional regulator
MTAQGTAGQTTTGQGTSGQSSAAQSTSGQSTSGQISAGRANQKLRTRTAIVQAAAGLSRTGRELTMPEIAKAALVSEATAYRYFPDLASLLREAIAGQLPNAAEALDAVAGSDDPVERVAAATEFLLRHVLARQGVVRALIAATITRPGEAQARPGLRFGLIDQALAPLADTARAADPTGAGRADGAADPAALTQLKRDLAVVISAEALFSLTDLYGLDPETAIASIRHTATTLTHAALRENP